MKDIIRQMQGLLDSLQTVAEQTSAEGERARLSGLEIPGILCEVVDFLMPELKPYEAVFYMYFFRHSVVENGTQYVRVSRRSLQTGIIKSTRSGSPDRPRLSRDGTDSDSISYASAQQALYGLEALGAIRQEGEPNRNGTLFRVMLPEEIELCRRRAAVSITKDEIIGDVFDIDWYNIRENRLKIWERDGYQCSYCHKQLTRFTATLDHITPVSEGGDNSRENLVTACLQCNSQKTGKPLGDFLAERRR